MILLVLRIALILARLVAEKRVNLLVMDIIRRQLVLLVHILVVEFVSRVVRLIVLVVVQKLVKEQVAKNN